MEDRSSALLVIDVQIGLVELVPPEVQSTVLSKIKTLLTKARASGIAVIFIQHDGPKGQPLARDHHKGLGNSSRQNFKGNLEKEALPTSSLLGE
jgi:nicotinamidase-related amidase